MRKFIPVAVSAAVVLSAAPAFAGNTIYKRSVTRAVTHTTVVKVTRRTLHPRPILYAAPVAPGYLTRDVIYNAPLTYNLTPEVDYPVYGPTVYQPILRPRPVVPGCFC